MILKIIIINYNGAKFIHNCLESVLNQLNFFTAFEIIVVDNASTDDSIKILNQYAEKITLIKNSKNVGFAAAHNQLIDSLDSTYIWLLNNDTEFRHDVDILSPIIAYLDKHPEVVGLSPKLLNTDGSLQSQGSGLASWKYKKDHITPVSFLSGAALFIRTQFFKDINGFDSNLFFYNDDIDFAMQVKKHHKKMIYFPTLTVTHHGGLSTKVQPIDTKIGGYFGSVYLSKKYYPYAIYISYYFIIQLFIRFKKLYYFIIRSNVSNEWIIKLEQLKHRLKHEL